MLHPKQHITDLSEICFQKGVKYVVISPGSRNAPLIDSFYKRFGENCFSVVDERSAGYFALGLARNSEAPVVMLCTSGTAVLNYGPSLAEAYYQRVPLIAVTADRPGELIDQQDNQTIRQQNIFRNIIKKSVHLPQSMDSENILAETHNLIIDTLDTSLKGAKGPVHINVPLSDPLYDDLPTTSEDFSSITTIRGNSADSFSEEFMEIFSEAERVMIIHGQDFGANSTSDALRKLSGMEGIIVIAENIANAAGEGIIEIPELLLAKSDLSDLISPDLIVYSGGQIVSKRLKAYLRNLDNIRCWRIGEDDYEIDTFQKSNAIINADYTAIYTLLSEVIRENSDGAFKGAWFRAKREAEKYRKSILETISFSDLKAFDCILENLPAGLNLELGNSSVIRYSQLFNADRNIRYYSNRGVSGIDGCLSTASGTACSSGNITLAIVGDLSFVYDSNALWNNELSPHLRIIVINNSGGDIFNLIDGPSASKGFCKFHKAHHPVEIQKLAEAFNLGYFCIDNMNQLQAVLPEFFEKKRIAAIMEIKTDSTTNKISFSLIMGKTLSSDNTE